MPGRYNSSLFRVGLALALVLLLARCTPGGQFDPTVIFDNDMFDTKKKIQGQREPLFPDGVPGTTTGVPADLVKGYQPPPDQTDAASADAAGAQPPPEKPKPKPKPKVAAVKPAQPPKRISIGPSPKDGAQTQQTSAPPAQSQSVFPDPPPTGSR
jgi:hypothetical protein